MSANTPNQPRQPKGVPTGGQWRAQARPEGRVSLAEHNTDRASTLWALVGRLERGEEQQVLAEADNHEDTYLSAQLFDDIQAAKHLGRIFEVVEALDETGQLVQLDAHGDCSCKDGYCPGFDPPRSPTEHELQEIAYEVLTTLEGRAAEEESWYREQRPWGASR